MAIAVELVQRVTINWGVRRWSRQAIHKYEGLHEERRCRSPLHHKWYWLGAIIFMVATSISPLGAIIIDDKTISLVPKHYFLRWCHHYWSSDSLHWWMGKPLMFWIGISAIASKIHFTLHTITMLIGRSWIVHLTPIPCSLFHFRPNLARLPHYV